MVHCVFAKINTNVLFCFHSFIVFTVNNLTKKLSK